MARPRTLDPLDCECGIPRWAALVLVLALGAACSRDEPSTPEDTLVAWVAAMNPSHADPSTRQRAYAMLASSARASLAERAARASQLSGREIAPWEMLAPGRFAMRFTFDPDALNARVDGDRAVVTARGRAPGERAEVPMVRENGRWRVALVLPPMEPAHPEADAGP